MRILKRKIRLVRTKTMLSYPKWKTSSKMVDQREFSEAIKTLKKSASRILRECIKLWESSMICPLTLSLNICWIKSHKWRKSLVQVVTWNLLFTQVNNQVPKSKHLKINLQKLMPKEMRSNRQLKRLLKMLRRCFSRRKHLLRLLQREVLKWSLLIWMREWLELLLQNQFQRQEDQGHPQPQELLLLVK